MGTVLLASALVSAVPVSESAIDAAWRIYFSQGTPSSWNQTAALLGRAEAIAAPLKDDLAVSGDVDIVVSGGGNLDAYYMGAQTIFSRVPALRVHRYAGASAGGMMPFEFALKGERLTLSTHFAYAQLCAEFPEAFSGMAKAAYEQDHHWRESASSRLNPASALCALRSNSS